MFPVLSLRLGCPCYTVATQNAVHTLHIQTVPPGSKNNLMMTLLDRTELFREPSPQGEGVVSNNEVWHGPVGRLLGILWKHDMIKVNFIRIIN